MTPYLKTVLRDIGLLLQVPGLMALLSLPVCWIFDETYAVGPLLWTAAASLILGQGLYRCFRQAEKARLRHSMITVALSWGLIPFLGAIPFLGIATHLATLPTTPLTILNFQEPWNALFESFSGFTSTGLSMALHPSQLPHVLQWWRSLTEWVGGVGVIVLLLTVLEPSTDAMQLYSAEGRQKRIALTLGETVRRIWWIYLLYTGLGILWLRLVGMTWWPAINHTMTGLSTGGFAITDDSIGTYAPWVQLAVVPIMIAGAISFPIHDQLLRKRRLAPLWQSSQHQALLVLLGLGTLVLLLENYWFKDEWLWLESLFQWVSALTTCGFGTTDIQRWSPTGKLLLSLGMIFGATSGSTVGGIKLNRVVSLYKGVLWRFKRISLQPHQMMRYRLNGEGITEAQASRQVEAAAVLAVLWVSLVGIGALGLLHVTLPSYSLSDVALEAASALGSSGLSTGVTHPNLPWVGKLILILLMWMGRLEIIPVLLLLSWPLGQLGKTLGRLGRQASS